MKAGKPVAFILLAFVIGATVSQGSFAFADDSSTNPFRAIWDAIGELQVKTESLQAQIDDLRSQQGTTVSAQAITKNSESSLAVEVTPGQSGQTLVTLIVRNAGPDSAVGVKLTTFYQTSLFQINFVQGAECSDGSRGIIECYLGTIVAGSEARVIVDATPIIIGQQAIITADLSSITTDANLANNHAEAVFVTAITPITQPAPAPAAPSGGGSATEQAPVEQPSAEEQSGEEGSQETEQSSEQTEEGTTGEESADSGAAGDQSETSSESGGESSADEGSAGDAEAGSEGESSGDAGAGEAGGETGSEGSGDSGAESSGDASSGGDAGSEGGSAGDAGDAGGSGSEGSSSGGSSGDGSGSSEGSSSGGSGSEGGNSGDSGDSGSSDWGSGDGGDSGGSSGGESSSTG